MFTVYTTNLTHGIMRESCERYCATGSWPLGCMGVFATIGWTDAYKPRSLRAG